MNTTKTNLNIRHCALCGPTANKTILYDANFSEADLNVEIFSARRLPDGIHGRLVKCENCEMIFCDPAVDAEVISQLYKEGLVHYDNLEGPIYDSYKPVLEKGLAQLKIPRAHFLEIGGGSGFMLKFAVENQFATATEVEPSRDAAQKFNPLSPQHQFICDIFKPGLVEDNSVSMSCFFQMLDHVPYPHAFLEDVFKALKPGGVAICVTHNTKAVSAKILGEKSPIYDIEHTYLYNHKNLSDLFKKAGFIKVSSFGVSNRYPIQYWFNLFPFPKWIKNIFNPVLKYSGIGKIRVSIPAGNFAVIGEKPIGPA